MSNLMPKDIVDDVRAVLERARTGRGDERHYLTSYQILAELPPQVRHTLIQQRGLPGAGAGAHYTSASVVMDAAKLVPGIEIACLDTRHASFEIEGRSVQPGFGVCNLYRVP